MLRVGLTGGLASGKSFIGAEFRRLGCDVEQADALGRAVLSSDADAREEIVRAFGRGALASDGAVDRKALAGMVFAAPERLARLNAIVHPRVFDRIERFFVAAEARNPHAVAVVEAAIMIESGSYKRYQRLVLAACPPGTQIERFLRRPGATRQDAEARIARQLPLEEKRRYADYVIDTGGTEAETLRQARQVYRDLAAVARRPVGEGERYADA